MYTRREQEPPLGYLSSHNKYYGSEFMKLRSIYVFENLFFLNLTCHIFTYFVVILLCFFFFFKLASIIIMLFCSKNLKCTFKLQHHIYLFSILYLSTSLLFFCFSRLETTTVDSYKFCFCKRILHYETCSLNI